MCSQAIVEKITNFRTTLGGKIISLDLFDSDFDFDRFTLWLSLDDISTLCGTQVSFLKASRVFTSGIYNKDCVRYDSTVTKYDLSVTMSLLYEYNPKVGVAFFQFVLPVMCKFYMEQQTKGDFQISQLPMKLNQFGINLKGCDFRTKTLESKVHSLSEQVKSLQSSFLHLKNQQTLSNKTVSDRVPSTSLDSSIFKDDHVNPSDFLTIPEFMVMPSFQKLFSLNNAYSERSKLMTMFKSVLTKQANNQVREEIAKAFNIPFYDAKTLLDKILTSWKSPNPEKLSDLCGQNRSDTLLTMFRYGTHYQFSTPNGVQWNVLLKYPYKSLVKVVSTALDRGWFEEVIELMDAMGLPENRDMFKKYQDDAKKENYV